MYSCVQLFLLAVLPALAGRGAAVSEAAAEGAGAGPAFAPRQRTALVAALGQDATLECHVLRLGDKAVSWVRARDLQILSHGGAVFTADARVAAGAVGGRHALHIRRLRAADGGRYECQVNTEPKMSLFFNLTVVDEPTPSVVVRALEQSVAGAAGGAATLACEARLEPPPRALAAPPLDIAWTRDGQPIDLQSARGGVSLESRRWAARAESRLTLGALRAADGGAYRCAAAGRAAGVHLRVLAVPAAAEGAGSQPEAMQLAALALLPAALLLLLPPPVRP